MCVSRGPCSSNLLIRPGCCFVPQSPATVKSADHRVHSCQRVRSVISRAACQKRWLPDWVIEIDWGGCVKTGEGDRNTRQDTARQIRVVTLSAWVITHRQKPRGSKVCHLFWEAELLSGAQVCGAWFYRNDKCVKILRCDADKDVVEREEKDRDEGAINLGKGVISARRGLASGEKHRWGGQAVDWRQMFFCPAFSISQENTWPRRPLWSLTGAGISVCKRKKRNKKKGKKDVLWFFPFVSRSFFCSSSNCWLRGIKDILFSYLFWTDASTNLETELEITSWAFHFHFIIWYIHY